MKKWKEDKCDFIFNVWLLRFKFESAQPKRIQINRTQFNFNAICVPFIFRFRFFLLLNGFVCLCLLFTIDNGFNALNVSKNAWTKKRMKKDRKNKTTRILYVNWIYISHIFIIIVVYLLFWVLLLWSRCCVLPDKCQTMVWLWHWASQQVYSIQ